MAMIGSKDGILTQAYEAQQERQSWEPRLFKEFVEDIGDIQQVSNPRWTNNCPVCGTMMQATHYDNFFYYETCEDCGYTHRVKFKYGDQRRFITRVKEISEEAKRFLEVV